MDLEGSSDSNDSSLDVTSANFNPLKALYSQKTKLPVANAKVFDNVAMFSTRMTAGTLQTNVGKVASDKVDKEKKHTEELAAINARRFQPHQMPVEHKREMFERNVLIKLENITGPLARLKACMDSRMRIKVITRHHSGIRGYCIGYLQAFDRLWNLAMSDVTEVWTRKKKKKVPAAIGPQELTDELRKKLNLNRPTPPKIIVKPAGKGLETCERYIPQLMMRGEHVVLINILHVEEHPVSEPSTSKFESKDLK